MKTHTIDHITIHHTGEPSHPERTIEDKLRGLQKFSQAPATLEDGRVRDPWPDVPYHYYIDTAGRIAEGREIAYAGDTNTTYDPTGHLLIVVEGNFENEQPTAAQLESLRSLVRWAAWKWHVPASAIGKHNDYAVTLCPGKNLTPELPRLRAMVGG
ncbi:MAG: N-acetylmuramoyl-L-alanine amidase [Gemmatimonadetes bacterium]|nr:N-acetylmuramoyl-L-alanine amidase [Gemmatimonadota bacterium]